MRSWGRSVGTRADASRGRGARIGPRAALGEEDGCLAGLDALHQGGIVHRDVKPDNIIVERTLGDETHVTSLDLGFAWASPERDLTGAPASTRQLLGGGLPNPRNDIDSVGALMRSMLTAQCMPGLSAAPEQMEPPSPRAFMPAIPRSVDDIVTRALSDVEARFETAEDTATAVRAALTRPSTSAHDWHVESELPPEVMPASPASGAAAAAAPTAAADGLSRSCLCARVRPGPSCSTRSGVSWHGARG